MRAPSFLQALAQSTDRAHYPLLFEQFDAALFHYLVQLIAQARSLEVQIIDPAELEEQALQSLLQMSFLGQQRLIVVGDLSELAPRKRDQLLIHLTDYAGPHVVISGCTKENAGILDQTVAIEVPVIADKTFIANFIKLIAEDEKEAGRLERFFNALTRTMNLSCAQLIQLLPYAQVIGSRTQEFETELLPRIIMVESSLFDVGSAFFAKDLNLFSTRWRTINNHYQTPFWLSYFSDQLFRAACYAAAKKEGAITEAQRIAFRLPYSFVQRDWKLHQPWALWQLHDQLIHYDAHFKMGGDPRAFEAVLHHYLSENSSLLRFR